MILWNQLIEEIKTFLALYYENPWYLVKYYIFTAINLNFIKVKKKYLKVKV